MTDPDDEKAGPQVTPDKPAPDAHPNDDVDDDETESRTDRYER